MTTPVVIEVTGDDPTVLDVVVPAPVSVVDVIAAGPPGPPGTPGTDGIRGSRWWISDATTPNPDTVPDPIAGDVFMYPDSGDIFYYTTGWAYSGSIRGPQGPPGPPGA